MAIDPILVQQQINRFRSHRRFPDHEGQDALIRAFESACDTDLQVREVGEFLESRLKFAPVPADVYEAAESVSQRRAGEREAPSIYKEPGDTLWTLGDDLQPPDVERWTGLLQRGTNSQKNFARSILDLHRRAQAKRKGILP